MKIKYLMVVIGFVFLSNTKASEKYQSFPEKTFQGSVRTTLDSPKPTKAQIERKIKYTQLVASMKLPVNHALPVVEDSKSIQPREAVEIARRAMAVAIAAVKGEGMPHEEVLAIATDWGIKAYLTPEELQFIEDPSVSEQQRAKFAWRYEGLDVLLWALGYRPDIPKPNQICDVKSDVNIIVSNRGAALANNAKVRSMDELLDMADYYYRLHWAVIELRLNGKMTETANEEIIMERHYALNWLIRYMGLAWDDINTDT